MKDHFKALLGVVAAVVVLYGAYFLWGDSLKSDSQQNKKSDTKKVGQSNVNQIISINAKSIFDKQIQLSQIQSPVVILNFWASWCGPCVEEVPSLIKMAKKFNGKIHLVAVSGDDSLEDIQSFLKAFPELKNKNIDIIWDQNKEIMKTYGISKLPESMIVTPDGKLIRKVIGSINWDTPDANAYLQSLTEQKSAPMQGANGNNNSSDK